MTVEFVAQLIGIVGIILSVLSFQFKQRKHIMLAQALASLMFVLQFILLNAMIAAFLDFISFIRTLVFANNTKSWAKSKTWLYGFILIMILSSIFTWNDLWSTLPLMGSILSTIALWMQEEKHIRLISLTVAPCWFIYNLHIGAYTGALNEIIAVTSIAIGLIRNDKKEVRKA